jgi:hypothetical protein
MKPSSFPAWEISGIDKKGNVLMIPTAGDKAFSAGIKLALTAHE